MSAPPDTSRVCEQADCTELAEYRYHWPGRGFLRDCGPHARRAKAVLEAMGCDCELEPLAGESAPALEPAQCFALERPFAFVFEWRPLGAPPIRPRSFREVFDVSGAALLVKSLPARPRALPSARFFLSGPELPGGGAGAAVEVTELVQAAGMVAKLQLLASEP